MILIPIALIAFPPEADRTWPSEYEIQLQRCAADPIACPGAQLERAALRLGALRQPEVLEPALRGKPNPLQDTRLAATSSRLAEIEAWIEANYPGGVAALEFEVVRCFGKDDLHLLVLCSPSAVQVEPALWQAHQERERLRREIGWHERQRR
jgi:hypothetical protein